VSIGSIYMCIPILVVESLCSHVLSKTFKVFQTHYKHTGMSTYVESCLHHCLKKDEFLSSPSLYVRRARCRCIIKSAVFELHFSIFVIFVTLSHLIIHSTELVRIKTEREYEETVSNDHSFLLELDLIECK